MNCEICNAKVGITFLDKPKGTYVRDGSNKHLVCFSCQKKFPAKEAVLQNLK